MFRYSRHQTTGQSCKLKRFIRVNDCVRQWQEGIEVGNESLQKTMQVTHLWKEREKERWLGRKKVRLQCNCEEVSANLMEISMQRLSSCMSQRGQMLETSLSQSLSESFPGKSQPLLKHCDGSQRHCNCRLSVNYTPPSSVSLKCRSELYIDIVATVLLCTV